MSSSTSFDANSVEGNAPEKIKELIYILLRRLTDDDGSQSFASQIGSRLKLAEVSIRPREVAPKKVEATVICELVVEKDMLNGGGIIHGGCSAFLIDVCTTLPLAVLPNGAPGVSQAINMIYHAPASLGTPLRIIASTVAVGGRAMTCRGEIWDTKHSRLVASGVHTKMLPSQPGKPKL